MGCSPGNDLKGVKAETKQVNNIVLRLLGVSLMICWRHLNSVFANLH